MREGIKTLKLDGFLLKYFYPQDYSTVLAKHMTHMATFSVS